jgi:hypothetical protein
MVALLPSDAPMVWIAMLSVPAVPVPAQLKPPTAHVSSP